MCRRRPYIPPDSGMTEEEYQYVLSRCRAYRITDVIAALLVLAGIAGVVTIACLKAWGGK